MSLTIQEAQKIANNFELYAKHCLMLRSKSGGLKPFILNKAQQYVHERLENQKKETGKVRAIILKGRQQGCSTYVEGRFYWLTTHNIGYRAFILTHEQTATDNLFEMVQRYHDNCPVDLRPSTGAANAKELFFKELDSGYKVGTAGSKATGRSSTIQLFHGSEVAFWPHADTHAAGVLQAISNEAGTEVILESTANGLGNLFYNMADAATKEDSEYQLIFIPWYWQDEYKEDVRKHDTFTEEEEAIYHTHKHDGLTYEHLLWRRSKIKELGEALFKQEYPLTYNEAFESSNDNILIPSSLVSAARLKKMGLNEDGLKIAGCDPAYSETGDKTIILFRQGRIVHDIREYRGYDTSQTAFEVMRAINEWGLDKVMIDVVGLGVGVYDQLRLNGYGKFCIPIYSGKPSTKPDLFVNIRAQMWAGMKDWFQDQPVEIPNDDELHKQICSVQIKRDARNRLGLESKEDMKKRGIKSPDKADALALTFAAPVHDYKRESVLSNRNLNSNYIGNAYGVD